MKNAPFARRPVVFGSIVLSAALLAATLPRAGAPELKPPERGVIERTGRITGWSIDKLAKVCMRLEGEENGKPFTLWFTTPAVQTRSPELEQLVMTTILVLRATTSERPPVVTVRSDSQKDVKGATPADAYPISSLGQF